MEQQSPELVASMEYVQTFTNGALVFGSGVVRMGKFLPKLRCEKEARVGGDTLLPLRRVIGLYRMVKRSIDLDGVEKVGEIRGGMKVFGARLRIDVAGPVRVSPPRGANSQEGQGVGACA